MQLEYEIDKKGIGERLQRIRTIKGYTQETLSEAMGCTSKYISKVENGASAPSLPFVMKFSEITGSDTNYLLWGKYTRDEGYSGMMLREPGPDYYSLTAEMSKKDRRLFDDMVEKLAGVLKENHN